MAAKKRIPLFPTVPGVPDFPGLGFIGAVLALFSGGILQGAGILTNATILGVP